MERPRITIAARRLPLQRRIVADIVWLARDVPMFPVERLVPLAEIDDRRRRCGTRIGWAAIFIKAYAIVARDMPVLRSWYVPGIWPGQATSSESVASLAISRTGEDGADELYWARFKAPDTLPLAEVQAAIMRHQTGPIEELFKRQLELGLLPGWFRRLVLKWNRDSANEKHATRLGTFSLSTLAGAGAFNRMHPSPLTTSLAYGPLDEHRRSLVTLLCDHRLIDGMPAARALEKLDETLHGEIAAELAAM